MKYIPDEEPYTDKYLKEEDSVFFQGWDEAAEEIESIANIFIEDEDTGLKTIDAIRAEVVRDFVEFLRQELDGCRQMTLVGIIEGDTKDELRCEQSSNYFWRQRGAPHF